MQPHPPALFRAALTSAFLLAFPATARAGMVVYTLTDIAAARLQVISFFIVFSLVLAFIFQRCWNALSKDFTALPALTYKKSIAVIFVASLFCGLILTMISGARELMTPGAWEKEGTHYKLRSPEKKPGPWLDLARQRSMENLRDALWTHASKHNNTLPDDLETSDLPPSSWRSPDKSGTPYHYMPRRDKKVSASPSSTELTAAPAVDSGDYVLAFEPPIFGTERFVLFSTGQVLKMKTAELMARVSADTSAEMKAAKASAG
jgi:hypothetical protein